MGKKQKGMRICTSSFLLFRKFLIFGL